MAADDGSLERLFNDSERIDRPTLEQILEMDDDDEDREFSRGIVFGFFDQVDTTFDDMETSLEAKDLKNLSLLGHFLKGSSATLGLTKMRQICEKIQQLGKGMDETGEREESSSYCLQHIREELDKLREEYNLVEISLRSFYYKEQ